MNHDMPESQSEKLETGASESSLSALLGLTRGGLLARNTLWGVVGQVVPMVAALVAIPFLVDHLGLERFGLLNIMLVLFGSFTLLQLGLGRALTQYVSERIGTHEETCVPGIVTVCIGIMFALGCLGALIMWALTPWLVGHTFNVPLVLQAEAKRGFYVIALTIPVVFISSGVTGILQAYQRFRVINLVRIFTGPWSWLAPLTVSFYSSDYALIVGSIACIRVLSCGFYLVICLHMLRPLGSLRAFEGQRLVALFRYGAWLTVNSIFGLVILYGDRYLIGVRLPLEEVAYYGTPYEVVMKLLVFSQIVTVVLFPAFSISYGRNPERTAYLLERTCKYLIMVLLPIILGLIVFARLGLGLWLGSDFAEQSTDVLQWLGIGVFFGSIVLVFHSMLQGAGRPDLTAKIHMAETVPYVLALWIVLGRYGIEGVAMVLTGRFILELPVHFWLASRLLAGYTQQLVRLGVGLLLCLALLFLALGLSFYLGLLLLAIVCVAGVPAAWFYFLDTTEKTFVIKHATRVLRIRK